MEYTELFFYLRSSEAESEHAAFLEAASRPGAIAYDRSAPSEGANDFHPYDGGEPAWTNCPVGMGAVYTPKGGA